MTQTEILVKLLARLKSYDFTPRSIHELGKCKVGEKQSMPKRKLPNFTAAHFLGSAICSKNETFWGKFLFSFLMEMISKGIPLKSVFRRTSAKSDKGIIMKDIQRAIILLDYNAHPTSHLRAQD